jgi:hypothetical protein
VGGDHLKKDKKTEYESRLHFSAHGDLGLGLEV